MHNPAPHLTSPGWPLFSRIGNDAASAIARQLPVVIHLMFAQKLLQRTARRALAGASPASTMLQRGGVRAWSSGSPDGAPQGNPPAKVGLLGLNMHPWGEWGGALRSCGVALL